MTVSCDIALWVMVLGQRYQIGNEACIYHNKTDINQLHHIKLANFI